MLVISQDHKASLDSSSYSIESFNLTPYDFLSAFAHISSFRFSAVKII